MTRLTTQILAWSGLLPFVGALLLTYGQQSLLGLYPPFVFAVYSGGILAFMGGTLWGRVSHEAEPDYGPQRLLSSNLVALLAIAGLLLAQLTIFVALILLAFGFWLFWYFELRWRAYSEQDGFYATLRRYLTWVVIGLHLLQVLIMLVA
ncbi:MAG: DUF3429 domain-containing protein [Gammaproteobacteria bacterium]|nr:DUF3429 domain-containing protein [Gammaproteobacteria bacterium]NVK87650.1 DUF3429 domain-containing protein [Gammaproteobacteria bacterium]